MTLITILFCLALQRFANIGGKFQLAWFESYLKLLRPWSSKMDGRLVILLVIAPILLMFAMLHFIFMWRWFGVFDLLLSMMVLFFCIDSRDLKHQLDPYFTNLEKSDLQAASSAVADFVGDGATGNVAELHRSVTKAILLSSFEQIFVGLFWYMVFGIYGVATYFLLTLLQRQQELKADPNYDKLIKFSGQIKNVLEWLPSRLLGFSYALVGNFNRGFNCCMRYLWSDLAEVKKFTIESGLAALDASANVAESNQNENYAALDLISRVLIIWLFALTLILLGVWL